MEIELGKSDKSLCINIYIFGSYASEEHIESQNPIHNNMVSDKKKLNPNKMRNIFSGVTIRLNYFHAGRRT